MNKKVCEECGKEKEKYLFTGEAKVDVCDKCTSEKLDLINSLRPKITNIDIDEYCNHVMIKVDEEVKSVFKAFGIDDICFNLDVVDGEIDLNILGFTWGVWFDESEGYVDYRLD